MFKLIIKLVLLISLIVILIIVGISSGVINISKIENTNNIGKEISSKLDEIGNLQLIKFNINYTIIDTVKNDSLISNKLSFNNKIFAVINGDVETCINLKGIGKNDIKFDKDTILISLPAPFLCNIKINYEQSKYYDSNFNAHSLNQVFINQYFPNMENNLKAEAIQQGILDKSKENAKKILLPILKEISKKKIVIEFKEG